MTTVLLRMGSLVGVKVMSDNVGVAARTKGETEGTKGGGLGGGVTCGLLESLVVCGGGGVVLVGVAG